jgi:hypothetical protein
MRMLAPLFHSTAVNRLSPASIRSRRDVDERHTRRRPAPPREHAELPAGSPLTVFEIAERDLLVARLCVIGRDFAGSCDTVFGSSSPVCRMGFGAAGARR